MSTVSRMESLFFELFEPLPRQGPGNPECTGRALVACQELGSAPRIVDLGCGSGAQTVELVEEGRT